MTNKRKKVVALSYNPEHQENHAPVVKAVGKGIVAEKILAQAKKYDVPVLEDPSLVELLANLNINDVIPGELYEAVAEVFAFIYALDRNMK
ncbi:MAG TPA: EscU/YscU/HrcU family type III secretion system export apparatus switch protein [Bacillota bacterium]|nr:EscU/YscU/HrcU family type III secretion system export apparatus switch protein [Bacillota bacterium]